MIISKFNKRGRNAYGSRKGFCGGRSEAGRALRPSGSERGRLEQPLQVLPRSRRASPQTMPGLRRTKAGEHAYAAATWDGGRAPALRRAARRRPEPQDVRERERRPGRRRGAAGGPGALAAPQRGSWNAANSPWAVDSTSQTQALEVCPRHMWVRGHAGQRGDGHSKGGKRNGVLGVKDARCPAPL